MDSIWVFDVLHWVFLGPVGAINLIFFLLICVVFYAIYLGTVSFFLGRSWRDLHKVSVEYLGDFYSQSVIAEAISAVGNGIAFSIAQVLRGLIMPIKLLSGWWVNLLTGPLEVVLQKGEDKLDELNVRDSVRRAAQTEAQTKRFVKREISKARIRRIKDEAKRAKEELRIPNFSEFTDSDQTDDDFALDMIINRDADRCEEALVENKMLNPAQKSIASYLNCTFTHAKKVQKRLHARGVLVRLNSGHMQYYHDKEEVNKSDSVD